MTTGPPVSDFQLFTFLWSLTRGLTVVFFFFPSSNVSDVTPIVTMREGQDLAASLGITYAECSSMLNDGVHQALNTAVELTFLLQRQVNSRKGFFKIRSRKSKSANEQEPVPPVLPPAGTVNPGRG